MPSFPFGKRSRQISQPCLSAVVATHRVVQALLAVDQLSLAQCSALAQQQPQALLVINCQPNAAQTGTDASALMTKFMPFQLTWQMIEQSQTH